MFATFQHSNLTCPVHTLTPFEARFMYHLLSYVFKKRIYILRVLGFLYDMHNYVVTSSKKY